MSRKVKDGFYNCLTYLCALIGCLCLGSILVYVLINGLHLINIDLLKNDYWSKNLLSAPVIDTVNQEFTCTSCVGSFSNKWGISLKDEVNSHKEKVIVVEYVDPNSPLANMVNMTAGSDFNKVQNIEEGYMIEKIDYVENDVANITGKVLKQDAQTVIANLDRADRISSVYMKTPGQGIKGSLIATLYLIIISLVISLPLGCATAIYLNEYANKSKINNYIRSAIEALTGVPSIVYGLMGVTVLFPITTLFNAKTTSILLGGLIMAIILLPTIIKSVEEALKIVPQTLRDASYALGVTKSQTIFKVVLPCCTNGILTGVLLSIGRVIGESAALIYTMGTFISDTPKINGPATSLSLMIWSFMSAEQPNFELACAISIIILAVVLILNIIVKIIGNRFSRKLV